MNLTNNKTDITPGKKKGRGPALFQLVLVAGFVALIWFSFGQNVLKGIESTGMPEQLGTLELMSSVEGAEALAQISKLHRSDIILLEASIGRYADDTAQVTVWVGRAQNNDSAIELISAMTESIASGNPVFSDLKRLTVTQGYHNHEVFQVEGPDGQHFFYVSRESRDKVIWLSITAGETMPILEQAVKTF